MNYPANLRDNRRAEEFFDVQLRHFLQALGSEQFHRLMADMRRDAPVPGALVLTEVFTFPAPSGVESALFSSIDVRTHLQAARLYFLSSNAAAADFLDFLVTMFPFRVQEVRTQPHPLFSGPTRSGAQHPFTPFAAHRGIRHSVSASSSDDDARKVLRQYFSTQRMTFDETGPQDQMPEDLRRFLYFHNHHRSLPTLGGKTPLRTLQSFPGFDHVVSFDPLSITLSFP